jgi:hypothetical protein
VLVTLSVHHWSEPFACERKVSIGRERNKGSPRDEPFKIERNAAPTAPPRKPIACDKKKEKKKKPAQRKANAT